MSLKPEEALVLPYYRRETGEVEYAIFCELVIATGKG
jgi:hypothetical protein